VDNWSTIASLATAGGTLVLAVATFASIRSANRSARTAERAARTAERSLLAGQRPLLVASRLQDPKQKIQYPEGIWLTVDGGTAALEVADDVVYMGVSIRNVGTGLAVLHGWHVMVGLRTDRSHPPLEEFTAQNLDIYVAAGDNGLWLSALRDPAADIFHAVTDAIKASESLVISLLYGDFEGGQRVITQFSLRAANERWLAQATRHFNVDRPDPRWGDSQSPGPTPPSTSNTG
jgi:hypothetical protein